jgi:hypothetical protein
LVDVPQKFRNLGKSPMRCEIRGNAMLYGPKSDQSLSINASKVATGSFVWITPGGWLEVAPNAVLGKSALVKCQVAQSAWDEQTSSYNFAKRGDKKEGFYGLVGKPCTGKFIAGNLPATLQRTGDNFGDAAIEYSNECKVD